MKRFVIIILFLWSAMVACQTEYKIRKLVSKVDSVDQALKLKEKYSKWDIVIYKLDSDYICSFECRKFTPDRKGAK